MTHRPPHEDAPLLSLPFELWPQRLESLGGRTFHARVLRRWLFEGQLDPQAMTDLPASLRDALERETPRLMSTGEHERSVAADGTVKLLVKLGDGALVETVHIPGSARNGPTLCVSTQVGCAVGCPFCASGLMGLRRNLEAHEIIEQFLRGQAIAKLSRAVIMGIGEPGMNLTNTLAALDAVHAPEGMNLGARRITLSTVGFPKKIERLAAHPVPYQLAISMHAVDQDLRNQLVPIMRDVEIRSIQTAIERYFEKTRREVTIEYVLLGGVNDREKDARNLARWMTNVRGHVNLIPYNPVAETEFEAPADGAPEAFQAILSALGVGATIRWSKGRQTDAACGQLRLRAVKGNG